MGVSSPDKTSLDLIKKMKLAELISVATRKDWEAFGGGALASLGGVLSFMPVATISAGVGSVISSTVPFRLFCKRGLLSILKSLRSWLVW